MNTTLAIVSVVLFAAITIATVIGRTIKPVGLALLALLGAFCAFGFLASFEPGAGHFGFRILYSVVGGGCLLTGATLAWPSGSKSIR